MVHTTDVVNTEIESQQNVCEVAKEGGESGGKVNMTRPSTSAYALIRGASVTKNPGRSRSQRSQGPATAGLGSTDDNVWVSRAEPIIVNS